MTEGRGGNRGEWVTRYTNPRLLPALLLSTLTFVSLGLSAGLNLSRVTVHHLRLALNEQLISVQSVCNLLQIFF